MRFRLLPTPGGTSNRGAAAPLIGRFKGMGYLGEEENRNSPSPRQLFGDFYTAETFCFGGVKVTRPGAEYFFI